MKYTISLLLVVFVLYSCQKNKKNESQEKQVILQSSKTSLIDSLKSVCPINTIDTFDIEKLQTDDFSNMILITENLFQTIYPNRDDFSKNSFFIHSFIPTDKNYLTLITYQKNYEGENYRVDYVDMINIDSTGKQLDKIRLTSKDNEVY